MFLFDLSGPQFLILYVIGLAGAFWFSRQLKRGLLEGRPTTQPSAYEIAYLAGGPNRVLITALARLAQNGHIVQGPENVATAHPLHVTTAGLEAELFKKIASGQTLQLAKGRTASFLQKIESSLVDGGWIVTPTRIGFKAGLPLFVLMTVGFAKIGMGLQRDKPVFFLILLVLITMVMCWRVLGNVAQPVKQAERHIQRLREKNEALHTTAMRNCEHLRPDDLALAVALFGTGILAGSLLSWVHQFTNAHLASPLGVERGDGGFSGGGGDGGDSGDGGGGGGCGGGCGGGS